VHRALRRTPRRLTAPLFAAAVIATSAAAATPDAPSVEYQVKAAYLSKIGNFVQWPTDSGALAGGQATICILGSDPFGNFIDTVVQGHKIGDRAIAIRRIGKIVKGDAGACQILYISGTDPARVQEMLDAVHGQHVLTVGDTRGGDDMSPVITFVIQNNNVRFEIDQRAAATNGLTISSQLLALAASVRPAKSEEPR
jgi:hypothetical protein